MALFFVFFAIIATSANDSGVRKVVVAGAVQDTRILSDPVADAYTDSLRLTDDEARYARYVDLGKCKDLALASRVLSSHANRLSSHNPLIVLPRPVTPTLLALDIRAYGWSPELWDRLQDPYYTVHLRVPGSREPEVTEVGQSDLTVVLEDEDAKVFFDDKIADQDKRGPVRKFVLNKKPSSYLLTVKFSSGLETKLNVTVRTKLTVRVPTPAPSSVVLAFTPFCNAEAASKLIARTHSKVPVVDGRWFYNQTAISRNRDPNYYDFIGVRDEADLDSVVGFDRRVLDRFPKETREAVSISTVTHQPRRIDRAGTVGGGYWRTSDNELATGDNNPLRDLDKFKFKARESFGHMPNGMFAWGLFDFQGVRQDNAPDFIASDSTAPGTDRRVHINLSCVRCHSTGGVQDIAGWVRSTYQFPRALPGFVDESGKLRVLSFEELQRINWLYFTRLEPLIAADRLVYGRAVFEASGRSVADDSADHGRFWAEYEEQLVDLGYMAGDLGVTEAVLVNALQHQLATAGKLDPLLSNFLGSGIPIRIHQWEELYPSAQVIVRGGVP